MQAIIDSSKLAQQQIAALQAQVLKQTQQQERSEKQLAAVRKMEVERRARATRLKKVLDQFEFSIPGLTVQDMPELPVPKAGKALAEQGTLHYQIGRHISECPGVPMTFGELIEWSTMGKEAPAFVQKAMGGAWERWFPQGNPLETDVVPAQVCSLLHGTLDRLRTHWKATMRQPKVIEAAKEKYSQLQLGAKRRKQELDAVEMETGDDDDV